MRGAVASVRTVLCWRARWGIVLLAVLDCDGVLARRWNVCWGGAAFSWCDACGDHMNSAEDGEVASYQTYDLTSREDGQIVGRCRTDDNEDAGYPTVFAEWSVSYKDRSEMLRRTGGSHTGGSGCVVTVVLDGAKV